MGTTAHDLWNFIGSVGGKTCFINHNSVNYSRAHCATVCFDSELDLASCAICKGFGYTSLNCWSVKDAVAPGSRKAPLSAQDQFRLARIYAKKSAPIFHPLAFVVGAPPVHASYGAGMSLGFNKIGEPLPPVVDNLESCLVGIESSLVSLVEQISELAKRLESLMPANQEEDIVMRVGLDEATSDKIVPIVDSTASLHVVKLEKMLDGLSRSVLSLSARFDSLALASDINIPAKQDDIVRWHKDINNLVSIFTKTKLKNKACPWLVDKFDNVCVFSSGLDSGYVGAGVMIVMNRSLARHVYKVSKVSGCLFCIRLLFKNKLLVSILSLYAGASLATQFFQADKINSLIARAVNELSFVILGGNFNKNGSPPTWSNSWGVSKTIDYVFVSSNLVNTIMQRSVFVVNKHFDMDHRAVSVSLGEFTASVRFSDLDAMWCVVCKIMTLSANEIFKKKWFKKFDEVFIKDSLKFHKLELLVSRIVKTLRGEDTEYFVYLMKCWSSVDNVKSSVVQNLVDSGTGFDCICSALFGARKSYFASKIAESLRAKKANIRSAINKRMESFKVNKSHTIRSVLKRLFRKVVLDHLVVNDDLILESDLVKFKTFSGVMCSIGFDEFFGMVSDLPNGKAAGLSDISNELWKHCDKFVLNMLLVILNFCLFDELVFGSWKETWVSMIPKPYE
ncbi:hypothetical protein G9A89_020749 [Geosiphon pyriformis]|nr:hypothetical protein G9A89_020749 [Geosiphon pyriformis]